MRSIDRYATAMLTTLIILQIFMLLSLFADVEPHPPASTPFFGMGPFIGAAVSLAAMAIIIGATTSNFGRLTALLAAMTALVAFGPQKYLDQTFGLIWPAVVLAQLAIVALIWSLIQSLRSTSEDRHNAQ